MPIGEEKDRKFFAVETNNGKSYVTRLNLKDYKIETGKDSDGKEIILKFKPDANSFVRLEDCYVLVPQEVQGRVQPIPIKFSDMPTGSSSILVKPENIAEINLIDEKNKLVQALRQIEGGLMEASGQDLKNSSRSLNKFANT